MRVNLEPRSGHGLGFLGISGMIGTTNNAPSADAASDPATDIGYRMINAAYVRIEVSESDDASRIEAGLTRACAGLWNFTWATTSYVRRVNCP